MTIASFNSCHMWMLRGKSSATAIVECDVVVPALNCASVRGSLTFSLCSSMKYAAADLSRSVNELV